MISDLKTANRVLITGGTGLLGKALLEGAPEDVEISATYLPGTILSGPVPCMFRPMDVRDKVQVTQVFEWARPDVVIHTASIGSVDYAERHREEAWAVNVGGTQNVGRLCLRHEAKLVFISSNAVFAGEHPFYTEDAPVNPINYYGQLKVAGEQWVQSNGIDSAIVRPILMYGWHHPNERANWVPIWIRMLSEGATVRVVDDVYSKPLFVRSCAEAIWAIIAQNRTGIYHIAGADHVTLYEFALKTAQVFELDGSLVEPVPSSFFPDIAKRPRDTSYDTGKMERELGVRPIGIVEGLTYMREHRPMTQQPGPCLSISSSCKQETKNESCGLLVQDRGVA